MERKYWILNRFGLDFVSGSDSAVGYFEHCQYFLFLLF